jgi:1-deoxy-D-xylulose-5-phosphate reductoisomerase
MKKEIIILGSTGSVGSSVLSVIKNNKNFKVRLLSSNNNIKKLYKQALIYKVQNVIINNFNKYEKYKKIFRAKGIKLHYKISNLNKIVKKKVDYSINSITGIDGLEPTLKIIPITKNILIANKESIICGWGLIKKELKKSKTNFIPIDSEHFSIAELVGEKESKNIQKIILTASGGPFLTKSINKIKNAKPSQAIKHPNWKMGRKISIDSSTMMNKVFELIEAIKIFNINKNKISIIIHPTSYIHAIIFFKGGIIKLLAHDTSMKIPISNAIGIKIETNKNIIQKQLLKLNNLKFLKPNLKKFPLLKLIKLIPKQESLFETVLITMNDSLVEKYLNNQINYVSIQSNIINLIKNPYFKKFYKLKPKNIYDIKKMITITKKYLEGNIKFYDK